MGWQFSYNFGADQLDGTAFFLFLYTFGGFCWDGPRSSFLLLSLGRGVPKAFVKVYPLVHIGKSDRGRFERGGDGSNFIWTCHKSLPSCHAC
jgi:hypothetical protein